jgi:ketosteroid isomerase-like protein
MKPKTGEKSDSTRLKRQNESTHERLIEARFSQEEGDADANRPQSRGALRGPLVAEFRERGRVLPSMYHAYVRRRVKQLFEAINQGNAEPVLQLFAPQFEHCFLGTHALGGSRRTAPATREWYARLFRLLPDIHFDIKRIWVSGAPWNTIVVVEWYESNSGTDGVRTDNRGIHALHLRWGQATQLFICPDTGPIISTLARLAKSGNVEAGAIPITDSVGPE